MTEREMFEKWWPSVGQTIGKAAAWEAWQAARATPAIPDTHRVVSVEFLYHLRSLSLIDYHEDTADQISAIIEDKQP